MIDLESLPLSGAYIVTPRRFRDPRGVFFEQYSKRKLAAMGLDFDFVQDNVSLSKQAGTIRGLHFQTPPSAQTKLFSVLAGAVLDVIVDIRRGSPTYGKHVAVELTAETGQQILVPRGFAHGFCTLTDNVLVHYKVDKYYDPPREMGLLWNDPELGIRWPVASDEAILVQKDRSLPRLRDLPAIFELTTA